MNRILLTTLLIALLAPAGAQTTSPASMPATASSPAAPGEVGGLATRGPRGESRTQQMPQNWDGGFYKLSEDAVRNPLSGVYAIWYSNVPEVIDLPFVSGGQIMEQWKVLEPAEGKYDFTVLDQKLEEMAKRKLNTTIQVNGNEKPDWLWTVVPYHPEKLAFQVQDENGTPMFWHPRFEQAYLAFVKALAEHIKQSPNRQYVVAVRMNFNAIGTESIQVPENKRNLKQWIVPDGVEPGPEYAPELGNQYIEKVIDAFVENFRGVCTVLCRNGFPEEYVKKYEADFKAGNLGWFYTGAHHEPNNWRPSGPYQRFMQHGRPGMTLCYSEPYGDAWGNMGGRRILRGMPPATSIYWQTLLELHTGVSIIASYGMDLECARSGHIPNNFEVGVKNMPTKPKSPVSDKVDPQLQEQFTKAFEFGAKYVGYHASPTDSPGAWIAFRQISDTDDPQNMADVLMNDCTFLMKRLPGETKAVENIGDESSRFHGYARILSAGGKMELVLEPLFAQSLSEKPAVAHLTYFDGADGAITMTALGATKTIKTGNSGQWNTESLQIEKVAADAANIVIESEGADATLHMVEVTRE